MSSELAIRVEGIGKAYQISHREREVTLAEETLHRLRWALNRTQVETLWALRDVGLEVRRGEVLGLIGRNGAGKSTLLKILSRITPPTTGRIDVYGRIGSLLEVGTGFHPELTGRENIYLNGSILGMKKPEIDHQFDNIVEFAGIQRFLDTPVKRYSSGMHVRLAFAVAAHLNSEILLVDEVLAVGDAEFQARCIGAMEGVAAQGRAVVFVSHSMSAVTSLCTRVALLEEGRLVAQGHPSSLTQRYLASDHRSAQNVNDLTSLPRDPCYQSGSFEFRAIEFDDHDGVLASTEQGFTARVVIASRHTAPASVAIVLVLRNALGVPVLSVIADDIGTRPGEVHEVQVDVPELSIRPARYSATLALVSAKPLRGYVDHEVISDAFTLDVVSRTDIEAGTIPGTWGDVRVHAATSRVHTMARWASG